MAVSLEEIEQTSIKYLSIKDCLSEKGRRLWAAAEAKAYGWGGIKLVVEATKISNATVHRGLKELETGEHKEYGIRRKGGGRKPCTATQGGLLKELDSLVEPYSKGDPESPLRWTSKSTRKLSQCLKDKGYDISYTTVAILLHDLGYSLQSNKKTLEKANHPDRDSQFQKINQSVMIASQLEQPAISIDTKKKENIGNY